MGRAKISMELIPREKSRNATFIKRKKGLKKKIHEFSILCGVDACMIIFSRSTTTNNDNPPSTDRLTEPVEVWPENRDEVHRIIDKFQSSGKQERSKRSVNLFDLFEDRKKKMEEEVSKLRRKNNADLVDELKEDELRELLGSLDCGALDHHQHSFVAPVLAQPLKYMTPTDHHHHHQNWSCDCPSVPSMFFDVGSTAQIETSARERLSNRSLARSRETQRKSGFFFESLSEL